MTLYGSMSWKNDKQAGLKIQACLYIKLRGRFKKKKSDTEKFVHGWKKSKNLPRACMFIKQVRGGGFFLSSFCNMYSVLAFPVL